MSVFNDLVNFAVKSGAQAFVASGGGVHITWDMGRTNYFMWAEGETYCYGTSERAEQRIAIMLSPYEELMLKWAIHEVGGRARNALGWAPIRIPSATEAVDSQWSFEQLSFLSGRLALDKGAIPMEMRTIFPAHRALNQYSHLATLAYDELLASYADEEAAPLLGQYLGQ